MEKSTLRILVFVSVVIMVCASVFADTSGTNWEDAYVQYLGNNWTPAQKSYVSARVAMKAKDWPQAISNYEQFLQMDMNGPLRDNAIWALAICYDKIDQAKASFNCLDRLFAEHPSSPYRGQAVIKLAKFMKREQPDRYVDICLKFSETSPSANQAAQALWLAAECLRKAGSHTRSEDILTHLKKKYPDTKWGEKAAGANRQSSKAEQRQTRELMKQARQAARQKKREQAIDLFERALASTPARHEQALCLWEIGLNWRRLGDLDKALVVFRQLSGSYSTHPLADEALFQQAQLIKKLSRRSGSPETTEKQSILILEQILRLHPTGSAAPKAMDRLVFAYFQAGDWQKTIDRAQKLLDTFPDYDEIPRNLILAANACLRLVNNDQAIRFMQIALDKTRNPRQASLAKDCLLWLTKGGRKTLPCLNGRYMDIYIPRWFEKRAAELAMPQSNDLTWELLEQLTGISMVPKQRQVVQFNPFNGGGAHSGNPVEAGPLWFPEREDTFNPIGVITHELAHNFHSRTPNVNILLKDNFSTEFFHHHCVVENVYVPAMLLKKGKDAGLTASCLEHVKTGYERKMMKAGLSLVRYEQYLERGGEQASFGDPYSVGVGIWKELTDKHGMEICPRFFQNLAAIPVPLVDEAQNTGKKNALIVLAISRACNADMLDNFDQRWKFPVDRNFYAMAKKQPANKAYQRIVPDKTNEILSDDYDNSQNPSDSPEDMEEDSMGDEPPESLIQE